MSDAIKWDEVGTVGKFMIGSRKWWAGEARWAIGGLYDSILRLFEQGCITRSKARELLMHADRPSTTEEPKAPWDELRWDGDLYSRPAGQNPRRRRYHTEEVGFSTSC